MRTTLDATLFVEAELFERRLARMKRLVLSQTPHTLEPTCVILSGLRHLTTSSFKNGRLSSSLQSRGSFSTSGAEASNHSRNRGADSATSLASFANLILDHTVCLYKFGVGFEPRLEGTCFDW